MFRSGHDIRSPTRPTDSMIRCIHITSMVSDHWSSPSELCLGSRSPRTTSGSALCSRCQSGLCQLDLRSPCPRENLEKSANIQYHVMPSNALLCRQPNASRHTREDYVTPKVSRPLGLGIYKVSPVTYSLVCHSSESSFPPKNDNTRSTICIRSTIVFECTPTQ